jgi:C1A family cysteine protease
MNQKNMQVRLATSVFVFMLSLMLPAGSLMAQTTSDFEKIKAAIRSKNLEWTPRETRISRLPFDQKLMLLGEEPVSQDIPGLNTFIPPQTKALPPRMDWRNNNGNWVTGVRDQAGCGSCWAFAATAVFESSFLLQQNTPGIEFNRSEQTVLSCSGAGDCDGGYSYYALWYISNTGIPDEACYPYMETEGSCNGRCADWASRSYRGRGVLGVAQNVNDIKAALQNGPTTISYDVYTDFYFYGDGVYEYSWGFYMGGHAVTLVGYDDATQAWLCKNSWDSDFGEDGYFWIRWGTADIGRSVYMLERNHAPEFNALGDQVAKVGVQSNIQVRATDSDGDAVSYSFVSQPIMEGASINSQTGLLTWTPPPTAGGVYQVTLRATDNWNPPLSSTLSINIVVCPASCNDNKSCTTDTCDPASGACVHTNIANGESCDDGLFCTVGESCEDGICSFGAQRDCSSLTNDCNLGYCNEDADLCLPDPSAMEGEYCDDGVSCTIEDRCVDGVCRGSSATDCSYLDDECNVGVCNPADGSCMRNPAPFNGHGCDDGKYCTISDICNEGACVGTTPRNCDSVSDQCHVGVCNEVFDRCDAETAPRDNQICNDGLYCTVSEYCMNGLCGFGHERNCSQFTDQCNTGSCNEENDSCYANPSPQNGQLCDDGRFCTEGETCSNGACGGGEIRSCPGYTDQCNIGVCNLVTDSCFSDPTPKQNQACDDGQHCTVGETCQAGSCLGGAARDCSSLSDQCNTGVCNENTDQCQKQIKPNGQPCDDGRFCNEGESCQSGACVGGHAKSCAQLDDQCNIGTCSEDQDACIALYGWSEGRGCSDGFYCTTGDTCQTGSCLGGAARDCSSAITVPACQSANCNDQTDSCEALAANEGADCDDEKYCTIDDVCTAGACMGSSRDCSGLVTEPQCQSFSCDELGGRCLIQSTNENQPCADGLFCTVGEVCKQGSCGSGIARDCSSVLTEPQCQVANCDEGTDACNALPANDGESCDDGAFCNVGELCLNGECRGGSVRDCSAAVLEPQCQIPNCDENADECKANAANNGGSCVDDDLCTRDESCSEGVCTGLIDTCDDGVTCSADSCNPNSGLCEHMSDSPSCDDNNECTSDLCDLTNDCIHSQRPDWTPCGQGQLTVQACLFGVCEEIPVNDRCASAFPLTVDLIANGNLANYHNYKQANPPCTITALSGPDAFYSFRFLSDEPLDLVFEYREGLQAQVVLWDTCDQQAACRLSLATVPDATVVYAPVDPIIIGGTFIIQVISEDELPLEQDGRFTVAMRSSGWQDELDGDLDGEVDEDLDVFDLEVDEVEQETEGVDNEIIDGDEDLPQVCEPGDLMCVGMLVMKCRLNGRGWDEVEECPSFKICEDGKCVYPEDGDVERPVIDGDDEQEEVASDGDLEPDAPEAPATIDGDDEDKDDAIGGGSGGGCANTGDSSLSLLLLGLLLALFVLRIRVRSKTPIEEYSIVRD